MLLTMIEYTHPLTRRLWVNMHIPSRWNRKKKNDYKVSLLRRTFKGTNTTFLFSLSLSLSIYLQYADLAQPEIRASCELVGTLNVWVPINTPINQSTKMRLRFFDASASAIKVFLSHCILSRIAVFTAKKRGLFGSRDVDCDSVHADTSLSLPVDAFVMVGSIWHCTSPFPHRYFFPQKAHWGWVAGVRQVLKPLSWSDWVKVLLRRSVYSNSSTGL